MEFRTEGIVLSRHPVGETSQLVRVMTDRAGLVTVYARGAKREYRRGGAAMDTLARSEWILRSRRGADFGARFLLEQVDLVRSNRGVRTDLRRALSALFLAEVVRLHYAEGDPLYSHLATGLEVVSGAVGGDRAFLWWFVQRTLELSGHGPVLECCALCGGSAGSGVSPKSGGVVCGQCSRGQDRILPASAKTLAVLRGLATEGGVDPGPASAATGATVREVRDVLKALLVWPVGGDVDLPTLDILQKLGR